MEGEESSVSNPGFPEPETRVFCYFLTTRNPGFKILETWVLKFGNPDFKI